MYLLHTLHLHGFNVPSVGRRAPPTADRGGLAAHRRTVPEVGRMITLPWPPSVNRMWRSVRGRNILSQEGRQYRENGLTVVAAQSPATGPPRCA